ncbi:DUF6461 domain-containing protein [Streptomyces sp. NPDC098077]|uniref:DUF6461 domain-containing protein n=1 Tax=Streptomyces sp. NPDC098077 TaxID=3366093 RepID=UPI003820D5EB
MQEPTADTWAWAVDPRDVMWCLTLTRNITPDEALDRYGAERRSAQLLTRRQATQLDYTTHAIGSVLRAGALAGWSFCFEDNGVMGRMPGPLSALSQDTETFSILRGADGMNGFAYWRDGQCAERFEPGFAHTAPPPPHPWWDAVQQRLGLSDGGTPVLIPVLEAVAHHTGAAFDTDTLDGPLLTVLLEEHRRTPDPAPGLDIARPPAEGRMLRPALPANPPWPTG